MVSILGDRVEKREVLGLGASWGCFGILDNCIFNFIRFFPCTIHILYKTKELNQNHKATAPVVTHSQIEIVKKKIKPQPHATAP